jgi:prephenate dehydrogenase
MTAKVSIVGLGQIGASIGLALAAHQDRVQRVGHDRDNSAARRAEKMGAVDKTSVNLPAAVQDADIVLLALPASQVRDTLAAIRGDLKEGAVLMDTGPAKQAVLGWFREMIPAGRYYIGLAPAINPAYLYEPESGIQAAHPDLFQGGMVGIVCPPQTPSEAIKLAADLVNLLGAAPLFADLIEVDGLAASTYILPQLLAAALLDATLGRPGWLEGRKFAGRAYAAASLPILQSWDAQSVGAAALLNRENVVRMLDEVLASLASIRQEIADEDAAALEQRLATLRSGREQWGIQRLNGDWPEDKGPAVEPPSASDMLGRLIGLRKPGKASDQEGN